MSPGWKPRCRNGDFLLELRGRTPPPILLLATWGRRGSLQGSDIPPKRRSVSPRDRAKEAPMMSKTWFAPVLALVVAGAVLPQHAFGGC